MLGELSEICDIVRSLEDLEGAPTDSSAAFMEVVMEVRLREAWNVLSGRLARVAAVSRTSWYELCQDHSEGGQWRRHKASDAVQVGRLDELLRYPVLFEGDGHPSSFLSQYALALAADNGQKQLVLFDDVVSSRTTLLEPGSDLPNPLDLASDFAPVLRG